MLVFARYNTIVLQKVPKQASKDKESRTVHALKSNAPAMQKMNLPKRSLTSHAVVKYPDGSSRRPAEAPINHFRFIKMSFGSALRFFATGGTCITLPAGREA